MKPIITATDLDKNFIFPVNDGNNIDFAKEAFGDIIDESCAKDEKVSYDVHDQKFLEIKKKLTKTS